MALLLEHWARIFYSFISISLVIVSIIYQDEIIANQNSFNEFSYYGVVATVIALFVAIFEVIHSIHISKGIHAESKKLLDQVKKIDGASLVSECLSVLDEANSHVSGERYDLSLKCFQHFRRMYLRIPDGNDMNHNSQIGAIELDLQQATHATARSPLTKRKRTSIQKDILKIKNHLEEINPARRGAYVSSQN